MFVFERLIEKVKWMCVIIIRLMINLVDGDRENNRDPELEYLGIFRPTGRKVEDRMTKGGTTG